jgi:hypothetical protein
MTYDKARERGAHHVDIFDHSPRWCVTASLHDARGSAQSAVADAVHAQPDSDASQAQELEHKQAAGLACGLGRPMRWQPQAQPVPGQSAH